MKIIKLEIIKAVSDKKKLFTGAAMIILYLLLFFINNISGFSNGKYGWMAYRSLSSDYMSGKISYVDIQKVCESTGAVKIRYSHDIVSETKLFKDVYDEINSCRSYKKFIENETDPSSFGAYDKYVTKRNKLQKKTYERLWDISPKFSALRAIKLFSDADIRLFLVLIPLFLTAASLMEEDRKHAAGLIYTLPMREEMYKYKTAAGLILVIFISAVTLLLKFVLIYFTFGIGNISAPIQAVPGFLSSPLRVSAFGYIFIYSICFMTGACIVFLIDLSIAVFFKNEYVSLLTGLFLDIIMLEGILGITDISNFVILKHIDPVILFSPEGIFLKFDITRIAETPVRTAYIEVIFFAVLTAAAYIFLKSMFRHDVYGVKETVFLKKAHIRRLSGTFAEMYKCLFSDKMIIILTACLAAVFFMVPDIPDDRTSEYRAYYDIYLESVKGKYSSEKDLKLRDEMNKLKEDEKALSDKETVPEAAVIIKEHLKGKKALKDLIGYSDYLSKKEGASFVNEYGFLILAGVKRKFKSDFLYEMIFLILAATSAVSVWSFDKERRTEDLIYTTEAGKKKILALKMRTVIIISVLTGLTVRLLFVLNVMRSCDMAGFGAPAQSIIRFKNISEQIKIWQVTGLNGILKIAFGTACACFSGAAVRLTHNRTASVVLTLAAGGTVLFVYELYGCFL